MEVSRGRMSGTRLPLTRFRVRGALRPTAPGPWWPASPRVLEQLIRTLTLTSAWRPLVLLIGLVLACIHPGAETGVFAADKETGSIAGTVVVEGGGASKPVPNAEVRLTFGSKSDAR